MSLFLTATIVGRLHSNRPPAKNCIVSTGIIDSTQWQAVVRGRGLGNKGCDLSAQISLLAGEITVYTRGLEAEAYSVSYIKQDHAGYWTACVSVNRKVAQDGTHHGEAYSHGGRGKGLARSTD